MILVAILLTTRFNQVVIGQNGASCVHCAWKNAAIEETEEQIPPVSEFRSMPGQS